MNRIDTVAEAKALDDRRLTEKARTSRANCDTWSQSLAEAQDTFLWTSDAEQEDIDATQASRDSWCMMAEVFESELRQRRAERPSEVGATVAEIDRRRAAERQEREGRYAKGLEQDLEAQRERSVMGIPGNVASSLSEALSPSRWVGLASGQSAEERTLGLARLALIAATLGVGYYLLVKPAATFAGGQAVRTGAMFEKLMDKPIPGVG